MNPNVTILSSAGVLLATGVERQRIDGTEMSLDTSNLLFEYQMEEPRLELSAPRVRRCDLHGLLTSTEQDVVLDRGNSGTVHRSVGLVRLQELEGFGVEEFSGGIFGGGDEHCPVLGELEILDKVVVGVVHFQPLTCR